MCIIKSKLPGMPENMTHDQNSREKESQNNGKSDPDIEVLRLTL